MSHGCISGRLSKVDVKVVWSKQFSFLILRRLFLPDAMWGKFA